MRKNWRGWIVKRKVVRTTTWRFRLLVVGALALLLYGTHALWLTAVAGSLVHTEKLEAADVLLLENFDTHYLVFEKAAELLHSGCAPRVLVPVLVQRIGEEANSVDRGFVEVMCKVAGINDYEIVPVKPREPISLNTARQIAGYLTKEGIKSVIVVSPKFRSARSYLVYDTVFTPRGIHVQCQAAGGEKTPRNWWHTWHGIQDVGLEFAKLLYYRVWVL